MLRDELIALLQAIPQNVEVVLNIPSDADDGDWFVQAETVWTNDDIVNRPIIVIGAQSKRSVE